MGPGFGGIKKGSHDQPMEWSEPTGDAFARSIETLGVHGPGEQFKDYFFLRIGFLLDGVAAVLQEVVMKVDLHRTGFGAGTAEGRGIGEVFPVLQSAGAV